MPRHSAHPPLPDQLRADGLTTVLDTAEFDCWAAAVSSNLGHHHSALLTPGQPFQARFRVGQLGGYKVLHLQGRGRLRLNREQRGNSVLWLPLRGITQERVNGQSWLAEPGSGLLFHAGDALEGETSEELEGLSILIPPELHRQPERPGPPLLATGPLQQRVLASARAMAAAAAGQPPGAIHAADQLTEALRAWRTAQEQPERRERITARRRRDSVERARQWMMERLEQRFGVEELSAAVEVSPRQLQYNFLQEFGRSPMAEAKRLRLLRLRGLLLDCDEDQRSIADLMVASGLIASGMTSADYRRWWGESPRQTRRQRLLLHHTTRTEHPPCRANVCG